MEEQVHTMPVLFPDRTKRETRYSGASVGTHVLTRRLARASNWVLAHRESRKQGKCARPKRIET